MKRILRVLVFAAILPLGGCVARTALRSTMLTAVYLDVAATPDWLADHEVVASWDGQQVKLPACITFERMPNKIAYGGFSDQYGTRVEFGSRLFQIAAAPECGLTFVFDPRPAGAEEAIWQSGIAYWVVCPADPAGQDTRWTVPTSDDLRSRVASGEIQAVRLHNP